MKGKLIAATVAAIIGMVVAVLIVNGMKDEAGNFTKMDDTVENVMMNIFKSPAPVTDHGWNVDRMIVFVHLLMAVLLVGWTIYYFVCLFKFNAKANPKADYHGVRSKLGTTIAEYGVIVAEVVLIGCFAIPLWGQIADEDQIAKIKEDATKVDDNGNKMGLELHILAKQFDWNARYAGNDNAFAAQSLEFANKVDNPFGIDPHDTEMDDVIITTARSADNAIIVPWDRAVALKITSMDVIHSFKVLPLRVCKDAIPGLQLPIHFKINPEYLIDENNEPAIDEDDEHVYLITCAQLCGDGHGYMNGYLKAVHPNKFDEWIKEQSAAEKQKRQEAAQPESVN